AAPGAVLIDLNAAHRDDVRLTQLGEFVGTPQYASPEQIRRQPVTPASDVYAACVVAYELLSGRVPCPVREQDVLEQRPPTPAAPRRLLRPARPQELAGLLMRGLAHAPGERPLASELAGALAQDGDAATRVLPEPTRVWYV